MESQDRTILVIEDQAQVRYNIQQILELSDYRVLTAENGRMGLQLARNMIVDLIICDVMMPEMDGYEVVAALREKDATATIPFIFLTAKVDRSDMRMGMELGADDYLTKPFAAEELLKAVENRFQRQAIYIENLDRERKKAEELGKQIEQTILQAEGSKQAADLKEELLNKLISDISDPVSNINLAVRMLQDATTEEQRDRYLKILQQECAREMQLLKEMSELQTLLSPENAAILNKFNLLNKK
ncbi:MAG: response regulator [Cyanobacteriota bacterium]|nr:response regulator [Cyanobacteriota bacterium]